MDILEAPANQYCSVARTLDVLGQKWTLLLLREAFFGRTRFAQFLEIGIPPATLGQRLDDLVAAGILTRSQYRSEGERTRDEYLLTDTGRDALVVLAGLSDWGDQHRPLPNGPSVAYQASDGRPVHLAFVDERGQVVDRAEVAPAPTGAYSVG